MSTTYKGPDDNDNPDKNPNQSSKSDYNSNVNMPNETNADERSFLQREWLQLILLILPFLIIPFVWNHLPEQMPIHWNMAGEPDQFGSRLVGTFLLPIINIFVIGLLFAVAYIDPRRENFKQFTSTMRIVRLSVSGLMLVIFASMILSALGYDLAIERVATTGMILFFMVLGNIMGRVRSNYFVGIRTPWTLESQTVWRKTHRMAAKLWVIGSLLALPIPFIFEGTALFAIFMTYVGIITIIPIVYSYRIFKHDNSLEGSNKTGPEQPV